MKENLFKIHPAIGIARLGNSEDFYLSPEQPGALPIECDSDGVEIREKGKPKRIQSFKDESDLSKVKRQAARFRIFVYENESDLVGKEIKIGGVYNMQLVANAATVVQTVKGTVTDIQWTVHVANKKASWYDFTENSGMHGYASDHPLRNPEVTEPALRRQLIIDPGPQTVSSKNSCAKFSKGQNPGYPQTFPPVNISPNPIDTLGELKTNVQDDHPRLIFLGGNGNSGSSKTPVITSFVNNDGWFDDISDGPVTASIIYNYTQESYDKKGKKVKTVKSGSMDVQIPAWVVVGYPRYVPQMMDMITLDEAMFDLFVRNKAYQPQLFGVPPFEPENNQPKSEQELDLWLNEAHFNPGFYPQFYRDIWPILTRPDCYRYTYDFDYFGGADPHNRGTGGNLDMNALSKPPSHGDDPNFEHRQFIYNIMRKSGQENLFTAEGAASKSNPNYKPRLMPMLCGNNPITNISPDKFLAMTPTQLFFLKQWADGKFVNECQEWGEGSNNCNDPWANPPVTGEAIDRGVLSNMLGGAFCPGGELSWIMMNPAVYSEPYRVKHAVYQAGLLSLPAPIANLDGSPAPDLAKGMEPGDLTKYIGIPWQADFHECTYQNIDITYDNWNNIELDSTGDPAKQKIAYNIPWWPAHRPIVVYDKSMSSQVYWASGIPPNLSGDLQMVEAWKDLGFLASSGTGITRSFYQVERNNSALGEPVKPGDRQLGQVTGVQSSVGKKRDRNDR
ncbi:LodA/GoxA family CTQ-dependent oxidase [Aliikangiella sp. G2MR2-5]|uniref:LodA/GoxA family CTQ-dependent oxidase n=1 Tax=Aliikangiella sp. G2MR2-5 TaxID=2788943 RepID=UPI0018AC30FF|nr:LodA/GoxA family CTQ-dependent oxidase [Aliikangiella sp. G2MR2-5]